jgi:triacylglycerol lipase
VSVLLVHGIWDSSVAFRTLQRAIERAGIAPVSAIDLRPNDGRAPMLELARQVERAADALAERSGRDRIDLVGFSMGALASRVFVQKLSGKRRVRRFVSISGPHAGTAMAHFLPWAGTRDMRPGSAILRELHADPDPWGDVEVHCLYTPFDLMIVPARSSVLRAAKSVSALPIPLHRLMVEDPRAIARVIQILKTD